MGTEKGKGGEYGSEYFVVRGVNSWDRGGSRGLSRYAQSRGTKMILPGFRRSGGKKEAK